MGGLKLAPELAQLWRQELPLASELPLGLSDGSLWPQLQSAAQQKALHWGAWLLKSIKIAKNKAD